MINLNDSAFLRKRGKAGFLYYLFTWKIFDSVRAVDAMTYEFPDKRLSINELWEWCKEEKTVEEKIKVSVTGYAIKQPSFTKRASISVDISLLHMSHLETAKYLDDVLNAIGNVEISKRDEDSSK